MKRKTLAAVVAVVATIGTASVLSAKGGWHEGGFRHHGGKGFHGMRDDDMGGFGGMGGPRGMMRALGSDLDKDGTVTLDEFLKDRTDRFASLDKNGDGVIDSDEITARMKAEADYRLRVLVKRFDANGDGKVTKDDAGARARERFAELDVNGDGVISKADRPAFPGRDAGPDDDEGPAAADRGDDRDDDSFEGRDGRHGWGRGWGKGWHRGEAKVEDFVARAERRFARFDTNNDGEINATDIEARMAPMMDHAKSMRFARLDKDRDGKVTKDEFLARPKKEFAMLDLDGDGKITSADMSPGMAERWQKGWRGFERR
ncbi:MAG: EF-hand domain-containing protein [Hyphomicrobiaceae bacterium]|nr:EF-hand domain-containing protein [Hyphomicrobiaceae bacterium]